jgi:hypothetical protein
MLTIQEHIMKKTTAIIQRPESSNLAVMNDIMHQAGQAANEAAARFAFGDHAARKAANTVRRKIADLALFETFLQSAGVPASGLYESPHAWRGVTWGLVEGFKAWQLDQGYAIASINAAKAGAITAQESILSASVQGYANKEAKHIDQKRRAEGLDTRKSNKKAEAVSIPEDLAQALKKQPDTPQGRRAPFSRAKPLT